MRKLHLTRSILYAHFGAGAAKALISDEGTVYNRDRSQ
jgi:hypothetical protein